MTYFPLFFLFSFFTLSRAQEILCSAYCTDKKCNNITDNGCTECYGPLYLNGTDCLIDTSSGYFIVGTDSLNSFNILKNGGTAISATDGTCNDDSNYNYQFYGNLSISDTISIEEVNGVTSPFYQLRLICWMILIDQWKGGDNIVLDLYTNGNSTPYDSVQVNRNSRSYREKICGNGDQDDYLHFDKTFSYNLRDVPLQFEFSIDPQSGGGTRIWGIKDFILLARSCHPACTICSGANANQCTECDYDAGYKLSGTTCNESCLTGYGDTYIGEVCVYCNLKCEVCYETADNCSACTTSGTNEAFLLGYNFSCESDCPIGYFQNHTAQTCELCDPSCISCNGLATYCYECDKSAGYAWNSYTCYNPCPTSTYIDNNNTNCTDCSPYCIDCSGDPSYCQTCQLSGSYQSYLLNNSCLVNCPTSYFKNSSTQNLCLACDPSCYQCTGDPTPCTVCNANYYLYEEACGTSCPEEYFPDDPTWTCLLCAKWCVKLTIDMYFSSSLNEQIYVDMNFTEDLDFNTFPYKTFQNFSFDSDMFTLDMFNFQYVITGTDSYRVIISPKGYMFLYNITITCTTMDQPSTFHQAINGRPFHQSNYALTANLLWFLIKAPDLTDGEKQIIEGLATVSDNLSYYSTLPYVQELKKMGIFAFLFGGAQITSCSVLVNSIPSQNLYEGVRFWAIFVFFDVPPWEENSDKTKYVIVPPASDVIKDARLLSQRKLFDTQSLDWRFQRTGHTSFFIFDSYAQIFMIVLCWLLLLIGYCLNKKKPLLFKKHMGKFYTFVHKVHEISILYISLTTLLEWIYFDANSVERWVSFGLCLLMNLYFLVYELYIYYDMIKYPVATIGSDKYEYYAIRYGSLLKNIRYEEYDIKEPWTPKQWFRPYNYHILSYYKKLMMMVSLPLFYNTTHAQIFVLITLQTLQIIRFCVTWPFLKLWRNIIRLVLECALLMFFLSVMIQGFLVQEIMKNDDATLQYSITLFYRFGWVGFGMVFFFNITFVILFIFDIVRGCKMSNRQMMDEARRFYYYDKLKSFEEENDDVPIGLVNKWVKLGNLNQRDYDELPDINLRVQYFRIAKYPNKSSYEIQMKKLIELYMNAEFNFHLDNNVSVARKMNKKFTLSRDISKDFYYLVDGLFKKYSNANVEYITIKTFQKVEQSLFKPGDRVDLKPEEMTQKIQVQYFSGEKKVTELSERLNGFPIPIHDLDFLK